MIRFEHEGKQYQVEDTAPQRESLAIMATGFWMLFSHVTWSEEGETRIVDFGQAANIADIDQSVLTDVYDAAIAQEVK